MRLNDEVEDREKMAVKTDHHQNIILLLKCFILLMRGEAGSVLFCYCFHISDVDCFPAVGSANTHSLTWWNPGF